MESKTESVAQTAEGHSPTTSDPLDIQFWYRRVHALCRSKLHSISDADDATQETFVRAIEHAADLQSPAALGGWLRRIAKNVCIDMIRRSTVRRAAPIDCDSASVDDHSVEVTRREEHNQLSKLVSQLPETQRETIYLYYYEKMTYDEMASWLNVARSTVNERLTKARQTLRNQLAASGENS